MDVFPLTEHGKINRKLLPKIQTYRPSLEVTFSKPSNERETSMVEVWKKLLNLDQVGIDDNFFDLGGDSILSIQMISSAKEAGIIITPKQVFQNPTIRELAKISIENKQYYEQQGIITGEAELTPIQKWFFENHKINPNRFNSSMFIEVSKDLTVESVHFITKKLTEQHDCLRLEIIKNENTYKQLFISELKELPISTIDLSNYKGKKLVVRINEEVEKIQAGFNINYAPLFRIVYFDLGKKENPHLLFVFHHLILDGVSWRFLIADFFKLFNQKNTGNNLYLGSKTTSYKRWSEQLISLTNNFNLDLKSNYWKKLISYKSSVNIPIDFPNGENTYGTTDNITFSISEEQTARLIKDIPKFYKISLMEILLYVLVKTLSSWVKSNEIMVELEGHGREDIIEGVDLSRTVGWFTTIFPVVLRIEEKELFSDLKSIQDSIQEIPNRGLDYGLIKYLTNDLNKKEIVNKISHPEINFNFLGQFDNNDSDVEVPIKISPYSVGNEQEPSEVKSTKLHIVGIINGAELHIRWLYSKNLFKSSTIKKLAKKYITEINKIIDGCNI